MLAMKKFVLYGMLSLFLLLQSCDLDDDSANFHFEALEITAVDLPETFQYGGLYDIGVTYIRPTNCHYFEGFDYNYDAETERTIVAVASVLEDRPCDDLDNVEVETSFTFEVRYYGTYVFNFWAGEDASGNAQYITIEVPVEQN